MIRVLHVIPTLDRSGAEKQMTLLATHGGDSNPARSFAAEVVCLDRGGPYAADLEAASVPVHVLGKRGKLDLGAIRRLRSHIRETAPDLVHSWLFAGLAYSSVSGASRRLHSLRCVDSWMGSPQRIAARLAARKIDRFTANSDAVADWYRDLGIGPVDVIPNAVAGTEMPVDRAAIRESLGLSSGSRVVLVVGRLAKQKRIRDLLWGFQLLRQTDERSRLLIAGDGPLKDELIRYADDLECGVDTQFLGHRSDVGRLLAAADVLWLGSDFEGQSNSVMEAMAAGVPVVATSIDANRELIAHGESGYLANVGDSAAFAQFSAKLFGDPELSRQIADAARERIRQRHSVEAMVEAYAAIYRQMVGQTQPTAAEAA